MNVVLLNVELNNLDIGIKFRDVREQSYREFLHPLNKHLQSISRDPDEMIFGLVDRMGTLSEFHAPILSDAPSSG
jgi:hypothetical protein